MDAPYQDMRVRSEQTVARVLERRVQALGDGTWVVWNDMEYGFRELDRRANRLAHGLAALGIRKSDTVLIMMDDCIDMVVAWIALSKMSAMEVPVNTQLRGNMLAHIVNDSRASVMLVQEDYLGRLVEIGEELLNLKKCVVVDSHGAEPAAPFREGFRPERIPLEAVYARDERPPEGGPLWLDLAAIMYTSGTTGPSKGVMITHAHAYEYALGILELLELRAGDVYYNPLPLFHIAGQWASIYACLIAGATVVIGGRFSPGRFWTEVRRHRASCTFLLGAMASWLYRQHPTGEELGNPMQRMLVVPLLPEIEEFKSRFQVQVSTTWGSTEINVPTRSGFELANSRTCGRVAEDRYEVRIVDENDIELPPGEPGEAVVRSKEPWILMAGYWNNPEATARAWRNQWIHTGDMMMKDESGNLYFVDRTKDAIRRRGENISSVEVESEINAHPEVVESAVIPVVSEYTEQEVMAVVVRKPDSDLEPAALVEYLASRMAAFMVPRYVEFTSGLPKTATGKLQKYDLRERGITEATWDRENSDSE